MVLGLTAALAAQGPAAAVYVVNLESNGGAQFGTVNLASGAFQAIGNLPGSVSNLVWWHGELLSLGNADPYAGFLLRIDPATGVVSPIGPTGLGLNAFELGVVGDRLYLTDFNVGGGTQNLYSVDPDSGTAKLIGPTGIPADTVAPFTQNADGTMELCDETMIGKGGKLYVTFDEVNVDENTLVFNENPSDPSIAPALYQVDPSTGATTVVAATDPYFDATVRLGGVVFGLKGLVIGFNFGFPVPQSQISTLDLVTGRVVTGGLVDAAAGLITGAVAIHN